MPDDAAKVAEVDLSEMVGDYDGKKPKMPAFR